MQVKRSSRRISLIFAAALVALLFASPTGAQTSYPMQQVPPDYVEANTPLSLSGDDASLLIDLPFPFTFYGVPYNQAYVYTNGYINFVELNSVYGNSCLSTPDLLRAAIYAFWDDLFVDGLASMHHQTLGIAPERQYVIEWRNVTFIGNAGRIDFEIVLHEKTGAITFQYRNISQDLGDFFGRERGNSATIGVENEKMDSGAHADLYFCSQSGQGDGIIRARDFAIRFGQVTQPVAVDIKPGVCSNPFNVGSKGVLPVAILGTDNFDVYTIDPSKVILRSAEGDPAAGVAPLRWSYEDVGTPSQCNLGPDGHMDLTLKFDSEDVAAALGTANDGQARTLSLTGELRTGTLRTGTQQNGTPISGQDVVIIKKGK